MKITAKKPIGIERALRLWVVFQVKLVADAMRDLFLSPVSSLCLLIDVLLRNSEADSLFFQLMAAGRRSERFINLFNERERRGTTIDTLVNEAETSIRAHHRTKQD